MADNYKVGEEISDVINDCKKVIEGISDLNDIDEVISGLLNSDLWNGISKEKCKCIQAGIVTYKMSIETLVLELEEALSTLLTNASDFEENSEKIKLINTI